MDIDIKALEKQFHSDGYRLGMQAAAEGLTGEAVQNAVRQLHLAVDAMIDSFTAFAMRHDQPPACSKGCHWCCHQPVFAMGYELDLLNDFISRNFDDDSLNRVARLAREKREKLSALKGEDLLYAKAPCPLLSEGVCTAYEARPVACRIYLSSNLPSCLTFFHEPEKETSIPALLHLPMRLGRMMNEGFKAALRAGGVNVPEYRIEEKIPDYS